MASKIPTLTANKSVIFKQNNETLERMMPKGI
jgi:hypothetical protein